MIEKISVKYSPDRWDLWTPAVRGRTVAHFGAADYPFTAEKLSQGGLLHQKIHRLAERCVAFDFDSDGVELLASHGFEARCKDVYELQPNELADFDVVVFGEIIEHLENPGLALRRLKAAMSSDAILLISTPNAFYAQNFINGLFMMENVHPDHLLTYSPMTFERMLRSAGFVSIDISTCYLDRNGKGKLSKRFWRLFGRFIPALNETLVATIKS